MSAVYQSIYQVSVERKYLKANISRCVDHVLDCGAWIEGVGMVLQEPCKWQEIISYTGNTAIGIFGVIGAIAIIVQANGQAGEVFCAIIVA